MCHSGYLMWNHCLAQFSKSIFDGFISYYLSSLLIVWLKFMCSTWFSPLDGLKIMRFFTQALKVDNEKPIRQMKQKYYAWSLVIGYWGRWSNILYLWVAAVFFLESNDFPLPCPPLLFSVLCSYSVSILLFMLNQIEHGISIDSVTAQLFKQQMCVALTLTVFLFFFFFLNLHFAFLLIGMEYCIE